MSHVVLAMSMTLDGFFCGPSGELDWLSQAADPELNDDSVSFFDRFDRGFIGYPTASGMIPYWLSVANDPAASTGARAMAAAVNALHPIILSNKEEAHDWSHAELVVVKEDLDLVKAVEEAKQKTDKDLGVPGGVRTAQTFVRLGLIDEYVLTVHPVAIGQGQRVFTDRRNLTLVSAKTYTSGVIRASYRPAQ